MMIDEKYLFAFALTLFAGLATGIGSLMAFFSKKFNYIGLFLCFLFWPLIFHFFFDAEVLKENIFDKRAEQLSIEDFAALSFRMHKV